MAPALDLRLRQHLALTPQLQQALRLLQLSAMEFAQEMGEALVNNPFLEEGATPDAKAAHGATATSTLSEPAAAATTPEPPAQESDAEERYSYESPSFGSGSSGDVENDRTDWSEPEPSLQQHLRNQLMLQQMGERDHGLTHLVVDALDDDGYLKVSFEELAALISAEGGVEPDDIKSALRLVQTLEPAGVGARDLQECLLLQLQARDGARPGVGLRVQDRAAPLARARGS